MSLVMIVCIKEYVRNEVNIFFGEIVKTNDFIHRSIKYLTVTRKRKCPLP